MYVTSSPTRSVCTPRTSHTDDTAIGIATYERRSVCSLTGMNALACHGTSASRNIESASLFIGTSQLKIIASSEPLLAQQFLLPDTCIHNDYNELVTTWPSLPLEDWWETRDTVHRWTQIAGKIRMELTPMVNHWWNVPLYVTPRGLTTSTIPYGERWFDIEFDFLADALHIRVSDGGERDVTLAPRSVADFHDEVFSALHSL